MRRARIAAASLLLAGVVALGSSADVVVLKGGTRIELKAPWVRQGNMVLLTRVDGTLLSVPISEIDLKATAAAKASRPPAHPADVVVVAPPETPAQAAKVSRGGIKARVKITDADVRHVQEAPAEEEKKEPETLTGSARLEVVDYSQEKTGGNLIVRGAIRNAGGTQAVNARLTVSALDGKGSRIGSAEAGVSNGLVEPGATISFSATVPVGEKFPASIRFAPQWITTSPPSAGAPKAAGTPIAPTTPSVRVTAVSPPAATPTPYGQGSLLAAPPASASTTPPADDHMGYVPEYTIERQPTKTP